MYKSISIIIPCYNEGEKLIKNINKVINYMDNLAPSIDYEIIAVNDGSTDNKTNDIFNTQKLKNTSFIGYRTNKGKGAAVKFGIKSAKNEIIIFMDADLSTNINAIKTVVENIEEYDIIIGSRRHKDSNILIKQPKSRQFIGNCCIYITNFFTGLNLEDTQCGFKAFKKDIAKNIIKKQKINRWAFDVEYLYIAKLHKYKILEIPVEWKNDSESTVSPIKSSLRFFKELIYIVHNKNNYLGD